MNLQQILNEAASNSLNLLPLGFNWLFIRNSERPELLRTLKGANLAAKGVSIEDALEQLGFKEVPSYVPLDKPSDERAYLLPSYIDIPALLKAHGWTREE